MCSVPPHFFLNSQTPWRGSSGAAVGVQPLHFGVLVIAIVGIAIVAPPIGLCLVILCSLAKIRLTDTIRPLIPYIAILVADLVVIAFWPWLVLILPTFFKL